MHYYQFNIGDYVRKTAHLDDLEDLAYRRMLDYCYMNECGLPETVEEIARVVRMRTHSECIANVLHEFFYLADDGTWHNKKADKLIGKYKDKSTKASKAAQKRWDNADANALQTECEGNANHKPITNNQEPVTSKQKPERKRSGKTSISVFLDNCKAEDQKPIPADDPVFDYCEKIGLQDEVLRACWKMFVIDYRAKPEKKYKDWRAHFRNFVYRNWYKLWFFDQDNKAQLTSLGRQSIMAYGDNNNG